MAFIDGALTFSGGTGAGATTKPYLSIGLRYQAQGRRSDALASFGVGGYGLVADGVPRAPVLATGTLGADVALTPSSRYSAHCREKAEGDHRAGARADMRPAF